jgi:multicomponent Na+:H+ antiporter subunit E
LANSISLTPGSLVLDISEEGLTVHCLDMRTIDANDPSRIIARPFEKHLEKSFG